MILNLFMFSCVVHPVVFLHRLCFHPSIMICNECICLRLLGWHAPFYFFIPSMFPALGLHQFFNKRSSTYKDEDEGLWMDVPPNTMESDSATTLVRDSSAISADDGLWRTPQRRSNRHASQLASANMKSMYGVDEGGCMSRVPQAPKRQAVGSPETGDVNAGDPDYAPITLTQSETDDEMQDLCDYAEPSPHSPITVSDEHCDKEQDPSLGPCTARLERISLGADGDARGHIEAKKKEAPAKRTVKHARRARKERAPSRTYRWVENCLETKPSLDTEVFMSDSGRDILVGSRKDNLLDSSRCAYPCLSIAVPAAIKNRAIGKFLVRLYSQSSAKAEQERILRNWLMGQNDDGAPPEVVDWARRRLCAQASSATSEHAFSKAGMIIGKKRQQLTADNVDGMSLLGWHYQHNDWGESAKRARCVPQMEGERLEEGSQIAA